MARHPKNQSILPLTFDQVTYQIGRLKLIKEMSFNLEAGKRTVIIGPNGAGKTLLLKLCHGLLKPTEGRALWNGRPPKDVLANQKMVFQRPVMLRRSVYANMDYALSIQGVARSTRREVIDDVLHKAALRRLANAPARSLSFGEQQRLACARAWACDPEVLILDEPTSSMDPTATHAFEDMLKNIYKSGTKIIMTTHDLGQARRLADDVMFLYRGRLLEHRAAKAFFRKPKNDLAQKFLNGDLLWWHREEVKPPKYFEDRRKL